MSRETLLIEAMGLGRRWQDAEMNWDYDEVVDDDVTDNVDETEVPLGPR